MPVTINVLPPLRRALLILSLETNLIGTSDEDGTLGRLYVFVPHPSRLNVRFVLGRTDGALTYVNGPAVLSSAWGDANPELPQTVDDIGPSIASLHTRE